MGRHSPKRKLTLPAPEMDEQSKAIISRRNAEHISFARIPVEISEIYLYVTSVLRMSKVLAVPKLLAAML